MKWIEWLLNFGYFCEFWGGGDRLDWDGEIVIRLTCASGIFGSMQFNSVCFFGGERVRRIM